MKIFKSIIPILLSMIIAVNLTSCFLITTKDAKRHDNGKHKGWYKDSHKSKKIIIVTPNGKGHGKGHGKHK
jgi:hypothetical protein